jgi:hypothetical protein
MGGIVPELGNSSQRCSSSNSIEGAADGSSEEEDGTRAQTGPSRMAGGRDYDVRYEAHKTGRSASAVKKAVKKVGNVRKRVEKRLGR